MRIRPYVMARALHVSMDTLPSARANAIRPYTMLLDAFGAGECDSPLHDAAR
jgi:hypothetical protein